MRNRLLLSYSVVVFVSSIVGCLIASILVRNAVVDLMLEVQRKEAESFQSYFQNYYIEHEGWAGIEAQEVTALVQELAPQELKHYELALINTEGVFILAENPANMGRKVSRATLEIAAPILVNEQTVGYLLSGNFIDRILTSVGSEVFHWTLTALIKALTLGLLSGFLMSVFMTRALMRPIGTTIAAVKRISQGNLSLRVPLEPYRDMAELGRAVNEMAADLEKHQDKQRYMLMDIAHDLRTPLSVQKATIEAFEDGIYEFNKAGIEQLKQQNNKLIRLVEDFRIITLTDLGEFTIKKVPVEVNYFIEKILQDFSNILAKKSIGFKFAPTANDCLALFDPYFMTRVVENLLQNAFQHSPENSTVEVHIHQLTNGVVITVRDQGPGIPEEKLETIFHRYYRVRREDENAPEGLGLGLTISKRIVESHDGKLYAYNSQEGGAVFVIELPCTGLEE